MSRPPRSGKPRRNPLLGAAVLKALLRRRAGDDLVKTQALYEGEVADETQLRDVIARWTGPRDRAADRE